MRKLIPVFLLVLLVACTAPRESPPPEVQIKMGENGGATVATIWFDQMVTSVEIAGQQFKVQSGKATQTEISDWEAFAAAATQVTQIKINGSEETVGELQYSQETQSLRFILKEATSP